MHSEHQLFVIVGFGIYKEILYLNPQWLENLMAFTKKIILNQIY